jgi:hypothetical protein
VAGRSQPRAGGLLIAMHPIRRSLGCSNVWPLVSSGDQCFEGGRRSMTTYATVFRDRKATRMAQHALTITY